MGDEGSAKSPLAQAVGQPQLEDVFDPMVYLDAVGHACGVTISPTDFAAARRQSGNRKSRYAKWSAVMAALLRQRGKDWEDLGDVAKAAVGGSIVAGARDVALDSIRFVESIADRVLGYLREG